MLKPIGDRVLLRRIKADDCTKGGLILSAAAKEKANLFEVVTMGEDAFDMENRHPVLIQPGCMVVIGKYVGIEFRWDGEDLLLVRANEILGCVVE